MAKKLYPETDMQNIANAIRALNGSSDTYTVGQMASAIVLPENAYYLKESASANPLSITDGEELKCQSAVVTFTPKQSGTGDPSPSNIRPISGRTELKLNQCGKNFWSYGNNIRGTKQVDKQVNFPAGDYAFSCEITSNDVDGTTSLIIFYYDDDTSFLTRLNRNSRVSYKFTATKPIKQISFYAGSNSSQSAGDTFTYSNIQLEFGSQTTTYEPYQGTTHTATFDTTIYGGSYDFVSGKGKSEWGYIAEYDGETINEPWISSIDVYAPGTTPSTGAEVAYKLATPTEITLTPEDIELLKGTNTVWSDANGNIDLSYWSKSLT